MHSRCIDTSSKNQTIHLKLKIKKGHNGQGDPIGYAYVRVGKFDQKYLQKQQMKRQIAILKSISKFGFICLMVVFCTGCPDKLRPKTYPKEKKNSPNPSTQPPSNTTAGGASESAATINGANMSGLNTETDQKPKLDPEPEPKPDARSTGPAPTASQSSSYGDNINNDTKNIASTNAKRVFVKNNKPTRTQSFSDTRGRDENRLQSHKRTKSEPDLKDNIRNSENNINIASLRYQEPNRVDSQVTNSILKSEHPTEYSIDSDNKNNTSNSKTSAETESIIQESDTRREGQSGLSSSQTQDDFNSNNNNPNKIEKATGYNKEEAGWWARKLHKMGKILGQQEAVDALIMANSAKFKQQ